MSGLRKQAADNFARKPETKAALKDIGLVGAGYGIELASVPFLLPPGKKLPKIKGFQIKRRWKRLGAQIKDLPAETVRKVKALPSYIKNNPGKFGLGLALKVGGGYVAFKGLAGLKKGLEDRKIGIPK